jgi:hypothetical protein
MKSFGVVYRATFELRACPFLRVVFVPMKSRLVAWFLLACSLARLLACLLLYVPFVELLFARGGPFSPFYRRSFPNVTTFCSLRTSSSTGAVLMIMMIMMMRMMRMMKQH